MRLCLSVLCVTFLLGCASGYSSYYTALPGATAAQISAFRDGEPPEKPLLERSAAIPDINLYGRRGYIPIGYSSFTSSNADTEKGALLQGKKVGADLVVIVNPEYAGSSSTIVPITTPKAETSYGSGTVNVQGSSGSVQVSGTSTTTSYSSSTSYIPVTVDRYNFTAIFFVKRRYAFGANWRDLTDRERSEIGSNRGVYILSVVDNTPAFDADILAGDIMLSVDGKPAATSDVTNELIASQKGKRVVIEIFRRGEVIKKSVDIRH